MTAKEAREYAAQCAKNIGKEDGEILITVLAQIKNSIAENPDIEYIQISQLNARVCTALRAKPYEYEVFDVPAEWGTWETVISWDDSGMINQKFQRR